MPSFATSIVVCDNTDTIHFELHARCTCVVGTPSDIIYAPKDSIPSDLDVVLQSDLIISLSGTLNGTRQRGRDMQTSVISQHLLDYLRANTENLGVKPSPGIFLDEEDGNAKLTLSPTRPLLEGRLQHCRLSAIDLLYTCTTSKTPSTSDVLAVINPFSTTAFLPLVAGLDRLVERLTISLIRQYPLIFGPWRERFDAEISTISKLSRAVADIVHRSPHTAFRKKSRRAIKALHKTEVAAASTSAGSLQTSLGGTIAKHLPPEKDIELADADSFDDLEHCDTLSWALGRIYKTTSKSLRYKGLNSFSLRRGSVEGGMDHDLDLSGCLDDSLVVQNTHEDKLLGLGPDARASVELWFDEDTETVGGSQAYSDLFYDDNPDPVNETDIWISDKADFLPYTPLEDSDDIWGSSQSTTLDEMMLDWADEPFTDSSRTSYTPGPATPVSKSRQRPDIPELPWDTVIDDDEDVEDEWPDGSASLADNTNCNFDEAVTTAFRQPAALQPSGSMSLNVNLAHNLHPSTHPPELGSSTSSLQPSQAQAFSPPFEEPLDETTSCLPLLMDDDLEPYEADSSRSRSSLPAHGQPTFPPLSAGAYARVI